MILRIYVSVTRVFLVCLHFLFVEAIKLRLPSNKHVLIVQSVAILCKPACVNAGTMSLFDCMH